MKFEKSIFIFRRDLRLVDNLALLAACKASRSVIPCFIFDPRQLSEHPYRSNNGMYFLFNSLEELDGELCKLGSKLHYFHGNPETIISELVSKNKIEAVYWSKDYTPFSTKRDQAIEQSCKVLNAQSFSLPNILLNEPEKIRSQSGTPYTVFTFFAKCAAQYPVEKNLADHPNNFSLLTTKTPQQFSVEQARETYGQISHSPNLFVKGGRREALTLLSRIPDYGGYDEERNFPSLPGTSGLSAHNKFGTISVREFFHRVKENFGQEHTLCRELYWRDFFTHIGFNFPHVFQGAFNRIYNNIKWDENQEFLEAWQEGRTGFPIVDAGMRQLNATGFMHNRVRMIVASFLTKDLLLDWHHGEKYFARKLLDYDPAVNNGNWQWAASTGCDAQPYFRIFNPWLQGQKFDKDAIYIKRWIPELADLPAKKIHKLYEAKSMNLAGYPLPIVEHSEQRVKAQRLFEVVKSA